MDDILRGDGGTYLVLAQQYIKSSFKHSEIYISGIFRGIHAIRFIIFKKLSTFYFIILKAD